MKMIVVQTQFEGFHNYPAAPTEVEFLKYQHRHMFHIRAEIEVLHDDRELEIIMVKRAITHEFSDREHGHGSCEMIAEEIQNFIKDRYPLPAPANVDPQSVRTERIVHVEVLEDGENGAKAIDPLYLDSRRPVHPLSRSIDDHITGRLLPVDKLQDVSYKPTAADNILVPKVTDVSYIQVLVDTVTELDKKFGLDKDMDLNTSNLLFMSNALAGEVGELANYVKKIVRDGESEDLWNNFDFEIVDCVIYLVKLIKLAGVDFDNAWDEKHAELAGRYNAGKRHLNYSTRPLSRTETVKGD